ncbi:hypothetical protein BDA99DRAFT_501348 [Phascolomyces articulosus]|uniref:JmjC domain-containing protein n=1 Tax=Phascolomyces articulosus TaxID=60185 RepID=A0AAD5PHK3_9FUNG|nr:hypothetical protein BDA99DRAFT_501348 [Phascolomyces articulosus]
MPTKSNQEGNRSTKKRSKSRESQGSRYERKIRRVKTKARSEIDLFAWNKWKFHCQDYWISPYVDTVPRIDVRSTPKSEFIEKYEKQNRPAVLTHLTDEWPSHSLWNEKYFLENYGSHMFKIGEDDDDNNVYLKMKHFLQYSETDAQKDDSPLYIFDSGFYKDRRKKKRQNQLNTLLGDYQVPEYFSDDLFRLTGERRRPPYRWLVIGGARSGTGIHTDPLGTSAWNALLKGHKRWCMFPPGTPKTIVDPPMKPYDHEAVSWFSTVFPKFQVRDDPYDNRTLGEKLGMVQVLQRPGETIFVPGGWSHVVMNLDMTFAVTQNFCSPTNAEFVYLSTRHSRPKLGAKLYRKIHELAAKNPKMYGELAKRLDCLQYVPQIPPSSSDSSGSSSTSSSSSSSSSNSDSDSSGKSNGNKETKNGSTKTKTNRGRKRKFQVSSTESETDLSDGTCMCQKCKRNRKREERQRLMEKRTTA